MKSPKRSTNLKLPAAIARSFAQLRVARSQCLGPIADLSTVAAIDYQLELRDIILLNLGEVRSNLAREMVDAAPRSRPRLAFPKRQNVKRVTARRAHRYDRICYRH
jgi:hypothetical protein